MYKILTTSDLSRHSDQIDKYLAASFKREKNYENECPDVINLLSENGFDSRDFSKTRPFLEDLKEKFPSIERVQLTLSAEPSTNMVNKIYLKTKELLGQDNFILEVNTKPEILGGILISYRGKYKDLSMATSVSKYFSERKTLDELL